MDQQTESGTEKGDALASALQATKERLATFLANNPRSQIAQLGEDVAVTMPWGDDSLAIKMKSNPDDLIDALNSVYLPERFTAIWHKDDDRFEVIYSLIPTSSDERERTFLFRHEGRDYQCAYGPSSKRLLFIAENYVAVVSRFYQ